ncbi:CGNR zinc finger domain-containing protein [Halarsenatibacter silvermanii]|uniref:CGNR zinc finger domain-containing protein n=1 Tax=Halarsenatibacter silvermanii TaxID=321763 RepID=A0A1G9RU79_9FIRM|nr:CGNR zinc finger domain-containing protein [Halarsenatibacter silvermanii]SDM26743.1 hypothetical protein SAMN04488692_1247 [Halarsenatibacter silvermanii]
MFFSNYRKAPDLLRNSDSWWRCSSYEIVKAEHTLGHYRIKPEKDAEVETYNPYDKYPEIIRDYINLLKEFDSKENFSEEVSEENSKEFNEWLKQKAQHQAREYRNFANKYGLLGSMFADIEDIIVVRPDDNYKEHYLVYMSHKAAIPENLETYDDKIIANIVKYNDYAKYFFTKYPYPLPVQEDFNKKAYTELISFTKSRNALSKLYSHIKEISKEETGSSEPPTDEITLPTSYKVSVVKDKKDNHRMEFKTKCLLETLNIMYLRNIIDSNQEIKICKECRKTFITGKDGRKLNAKYCSSACGNRYRVRKSRKKQEASND